MTDTATYERLQKDVKAVKSDIAALTDQITDALNSFASDASKQARRGSDRILPESPRHGIAVKSRQPDIAEHHLRRGSAGGRDSFRP